MADLMKLSPSTTMTQSFSTNCLNTILLNGANDEHNFSSLRIEDPKKVNNLENDIHLKTMTNEVPQINEFFNIIDKLGEGTFSKVYKAKLKRDWIDVCCTKNCNNDNNNDNNNNNNKKNFESSAEYALKYVLPIVKPSRIAKELRFLRDLGGVSNIIPIETCFYNAGHTVIVMPIVEHDRFIDYLPDMDCDEIKFYMRKLLEALERVHSFGIIHRDIKPTNFLYNRKTGQCALVDFGLSQFEKELSHSINLSLLKTNSENSKIRKKLERKFGTIKTNNNNNNEESKKSVKRSFNDMTNNVAEEANKRFKLNNQQHASIFISPISPSKDHHNNQENSNSKIILVSNSPEKPKRVPLLENQNLINQQQSIVEEAPMTPIEINSNPYETPIKNQLLTINDANKTPIKGNKIILVPETPPKTLQKNFNFIMTTPPVKDILKENNNNNNNNNQQNNNFNGTYSTPKSTSKATLLQRYQVAKKILYPELSSITNNGNANNNNNNNDANNQPNEPQQCACTRMAIICGGCLLKSELYVPRAGTPGFRAPEILLRSQNQSTKIDIWSCGVIFASLLSGRYPFFRCTDDMTSLAEIITVVGSSKVKRAANALGKTLMISRRSIPAMKLKSICVQLRKSSKLSSSTKGDNNNNNNNSNDDDDDDDADDEEEEEDEDDDDEDYEEQFPDSAYDLLEHLLDPNPYTRYTAKMALSHPFFNESKNLQCEQQQQQKEQEEEKEVSAQTESEADEDEAEEIQSEFN